MTEQRVPLSTYRLQMTPDFRFEDARAIVPYLARLGITDLYASPILRSVRGSTHGYDVADPTRLDPELGGDAGFDRLSHALTEHGMGLLLDIVPNHMAASVENPWWRDLLESGKASRYASFFDINWQPACSAVRDRVVLPVLGGPFGEVLDSGELQLALRGGELVVRYYDRWFPLDIKSYAPVLWRVLESVSESQASARLAELTEQIEALPGNTANDAPASADRRRLLKRQVWETIYATPGLVEQLQRAIDSINEGSGQARSEGELGAILTGQAYQLAFWKTAREELNYRRFFDISDLASLRADDPDVFEASHSLVLELVRQGKVTGLRIDHIDGLRDPRGYLERLQERLSDVSGGNGSPLPFYVLVEKILSGYEELPGDRPASGTTGYEYISALNSVFVDPRGFSSMKNAYEQFTGLKADFADTVYQKKLQVIEWLFPAEVRQLGHQLAGLAQQDRHALDISRHDLTQAMVQVTACLPVYRTYIHSFQVPLEARQVIEQTVDEARKRAADVDSRAFDLLRRVLTLEIPAYVSGDQREGWLRFVMDWQQLTGPAMAKGFEDTTLYNYNVLVSLNEVGGDPGIEDFSVERFHRFNHSRRANWPYSMNASSTHDTKRSEDVRARLNVLSEVADEWYQRLLRWSRWNEQKKRRVGELLVPDPNTEIIIYQNMLGAWPLYEHEEAEFRERLQGYVVKAAREAKAITNWLSPNEEVEEALTAVVAEVMDDSRQNLFLGDFREFQERLAFYGAVNSLSQTLLKLASPGVPDLYQGTDMWDFSLVDPDNRRPVDFNKRTEHLEAFTAQEQTSRQSLVRELLESWRDGRVKLYLTYNALRARKSHPELFLDGDYLPLEARGQGQDNVCAFARRHGTDWAIAAVPRLVTRLSEEGVFPLGSQAWGEDVLLLPDEAPSRWRNVITGEELAARGKGLRLAEVFSSLPVGLLVSNL